MISYGSTFTGILGLDRAFEDVLGATCRWACERSAYCREIIHQRHGAGGDLFVVPDIALVDRGAVPSVDAIIGGFPCQDVSAAGGRRGLEHGERTGLWHELARVIDDLRPTIGFFENVRGLLGRGLDHVLADLACLGFDAEWTCVRAADVGAPHRRERVFILATTADGRERLADAYGRRLRQLAERNRRGQALGCDPPSLDAGAHDMGDADRLGCEGTLDVSAIERAAAARAGRRVADTTGPQRLGMRRGPEDGRGEGEGWARPGRDGARNGVADAARRGHTPEAAGRRGRSPESVGEPPDGGLDVADRVHDGRGEFGSRDDDDRRDAPGDLAHGRDACGIRDHRWPPGPADAQGWARWTGARPSVRRSPDGLPAWVDRSRLAEGLRRARLRALGNAVVSQQAAYALEILIPRALCG